MGQDKALLQWGGQRAIDRLVNLLTEMACRPVLVSGADYGLPFVPDPTQGGGPVGGLKATLKRLAEQDCTMAIVLAVDAPTITIADLSPLIACGPPGAAYAGLPLPMVVTVTAAEAELDDDAPLHRFVEYADLQVLACPRSIEDRLRGANTPDERAALLGLNSDMNQGRRQSKVKRSPLGRP